ncbi:hypothetical protein [Pseudomonas syringae]
MNIEFDLNVNDAEALLRHCQTHVPASGDPREDARLMDALAALVEALTTPGAQS